MTSAAFSKAVAYPKASWTKANVVVDRLGDADHRHRRASALQLLTQRMRTALRAVAAHAKQNIDPMGLQKVGHHGGRLAAARTAQHGATQFVDRFDKLLAQHDRLQTRLGIQSQIAVADTEHTTHAVVFSEFIKHRANHVVQSRRQAAAGHDRSRRLLRPKENVLPRSGHLEGQRISIDGSRTQHNIEPNAIRVGDKIARIFCTGRALIQWRGILALAK